MFTCIFSFLYSIVSNITLVYVVSISCIQWETLYEICGRQSVKITKQGERKVFKGAEDKKQKIKMSFL